METNTYLAHNLADRVGEALEDPNAEQTPKATRLFWVNRALERFSDDTKLFRTTSLMALASYTIEYTLPDKVLMVEGVESREQSSNPWKRIDHKAYRYLVDYQDDLSVPASYPCYYSVRGKKLWLWQCVGYQAVTDGTISIDGTQYIYGTSTNWLTSPTSLAVGNQISVAGSLVSITAVSTGTSITLSTSVEAYNAGSTATAQAYSANKGGLEDRIRLKFAYRHPKVTWTDVGTVSMTAAKTKIIGTGTDFTTLQTGDVLEVVGNGTCSITAVSGTNSLTCTVFTGTTLSGGESFKASTPLDSKLAPHLEGLMSYVIARLLRRDRRAEFKLWMGEYERDARGARISRDASEPTHVEDTMGWLV